MFNILIVEDDKNTRKLMNAVISADGYKTFTAENGIEALDIFDKEHIDLIVLDIMMPKMDGYEFTKVFRSCNNTLPILMVSAKQLPEDKKRGFLAGTDDYMTKPVDEEEMLLRIKALLRRSAIVNERRLIISSVVLDYDTLTVTRYEDVQVLPQKEFHLL
ncbi:MAG: response regulator transcription factor, partial [Flavobacterium sp.]